MSDRTVGYTVNCMMCGKCSGIVKGGVFFRAPKAPPLKNRASRTRCGFCSGNLYLEPATEEELKKLEGKEDETQPTENPPASNAASPSESE